ncbi:hypothetical protein ACM9HC_21300, partial [Streptomyces sp. JAC18]|uniref:hypothetical protein n=1 Tax=Streptomyces sp. JAC18 TaxID=3418414 RepID=UPI003D81BB7B
PDAPVVEQLAVPPAAAAGADAAIATVIAVAARTVPTRVVRREIFINPPVDYFFDLIVREILLQGVSVISALCGVCNRQRTG